MFLPWQQQNRLHNIQIRMSLKVLFIPPKCTFGPIFNFESRDLIGFDDIIPVIFYL